MENPTGEPRWYYYNVRTGSVESLSTKSGAKDVLGPYDTYEAAAAALAAARARTEAWDDEDRRWNDPHPDAD